MKKKYYLAKAKFGHVGKGCYIAKVIPIQANDIHEAAYIARWTPRVKHHNKKAILSLREVNYESYVEALRIHELDPFFICRNKREQNLKCPNIETEKIIMDRKERQPLKKLNSHYKQMINKDLIIQAYYDYQEYCSQA